jgi:hypothetical protein
MAEDEDDLKRVAWFLEDVGTVTLLPLALSGSLLFEPTGLGQLFYGLVGAAGGISLAYKLGVLGGEEE